MKNYRFREPCPSALCVVRGGYFDAVLSCLGPRTQMHFLCTRHHRRDRLVDRVIDHT